MKASSFLLQLFLGLTLLLGQVKPDPDPLEDYCIADTKNPKTFFINGAPCIDPTLAVASHFTTSALAQPGNTSANPFDYNVTYANIVNLPGLNTMGLTMARVDLDANGLVPPHSHPRASEVTICVKGALLVGFVNTSGHLFNEKLQPGDSFVFPKGLIHFLYNMDSKAPALAISGFSSQNPGSQVSSLSIFTSKPSIPENVLKKAFQIKGEDVARIRRNLGG